MTHMDYWKTQLDKDIDKHILKLDVGKPRLGLVPPEMIEAVGQVMTYGLQKYEQDSWRKVDAFRYKDALMRHITEYLKDPKALDPESQLSHLKHIACNVAFLLVLDK